MTVNNQVDIVVGWTSLLRGASKRTSEDVLHSCVYESLFKPGPKVN
ncbi:hypothetical protein RAHE111665_07840 [Rariglobus hedericola]